jgi:hypothetical protein
MEAKEWLNSSKNECALAGNRFENTEDAIEFVEMLYEKGAIRITIEPMEGRTDYADTLIVELPQDKSKRDEILKIYYEEMENELGSIDELLLSSGFPADEIEIIKEEAQNSDVIEFWWD